MAKPTDPKTGDGAASPRAKRRGGGRTLHKDAKKKRFLTELAGGASVGKAAAAVGIGRRTAYDWRSGDEAFAAAWDEAYETGTDLMEDEAKRRGIDGVDEPIYYKGEQCGTVRKYSDLLLMAQLNARRPEKYRQRTSTELTGKNGAPLFPHVHVTFSDSDSGND